MNFKFSERLIAVIPAKAGIQCLYFLCILCVLCAKQAFAASAEDALTRFVDSVHTLSARFDQVQKDEKGEVLQSVSGHMSLARPGRFHWKVGKPYEQLIVADGSFVWLYDPDLKQVTKRPAGEALAGTPAQLLSQDTALSDAFRIEDGGSEGNQRIVRLTPKAADADFKSVELWLDGATPTRMRFYDQLGGTTDVRFTDIAVNQPVQLSLFEFTPPKGVEVVDTTQQQNAPPP